MAIYIRHGDDEHLPGKTWKHDTPLTDRGKQEARRTALVLKEAYGIPTSIVCSPYMRARQTAENMVKALEISIPIVIDNNLSKFVTPQNLKNLDIRNDTLRHSPPILESKAEFKQRVRQHLAQNVIHRSTAIEMVWYITHGIFVREVAVHYNVDAPSNIGSCHWINVGTKDSSWAVKKRLQTTQLVYDKTDRDGAVFFATDTSTDSERLSSLSQQQQDQELLPPGVYISDKHRTNRNHIIAVQLANRGLIQFSSFRVLDNNNVFDPEQIGYHNNNNTNSFVKNYIKTSPSSKKTHTTTLDKTQNQMVDVSYNNVPRFSV